MKDPVIVEREVLRDIELRLRRLIAQIQEWPEYEWGLQEEQEQEERR